MRPPATALAPPHHDAVPRRAAQGAEVEVSGDLPQAALAEGLLPRPPPAGTLAGKKEQTVSELIELPDLLRLACTDNLSLSNKALFTMLERLKKLKQDSSLEGVRALEVALTTLREHDCVAKLLAKYASSPDKLMAENLLLLLDTLAKFPWCMMDCVRPPRPAPPRPGACPTPSGRHRAGGGPAATCGRGTGR